MLNSLVGEFCGWQTILPSDRNNYKIFPSLQTLAKWQGKSLKGYSAYIK